MIFTPCLVQTTMNNLSDAQSLAEILLTSHLAACVQLEPINSMYRWEGKICQEKEVRLSIKTALTLFPSVEEMIRKHHPYDCPEILALPMIEISVDYRQWLEDCLQA